MTTLYYTRNRKFVQAPAHPGAEAARKAKLYHRFRIFCLFCTNFIFPHRASRGTLKTGAAQGGAGNGGFPYEAIPCPKYLPSAEAKRPDTGAAGGSAGRDRYPNDFRVVYRCGSLYELAGLEQNRPDWLRRGRDLLERSLPLLSQNTDPAVSDIFIQYHIAQCCLKLGEGDQALEILKKTNICGVHNALIALILSSGRHPLREAESYLTNAMGDLTSLSVRLMTAYVYYYQRKGDDSSALDALQWLCHLLDSLKTGPDAVSYVDKILACCCAECAHLSRELGRPEEAEDWLRRACRIGTAFDAAPTYRMDSVKFCAGTVSEATVYDDLGESALASVERQLTEGDHDDELLALWRQLCAEDAQKEDQP